MAYTTAGNLKPPPCLLICQWVVKALNSIPQEMIKKSFKMCAISNALDGSEDNQILCLREGEHSAVVRDDIRDLTVEINRNRGN